MAVVGCSEKMKLDLGAGRGEGKFRVGMHSGE